MKKLLAVVVLGVRSKLVIRESIAALREAKEWSGNNSMSAGSQKATDAKPCILGCFVSCRFSFFKVIIFVCF